MKGICQCCECAYYNMKQHKCNRGCKAEPELSKDEDVRFFVDCPLPEVEAVKHGEWDGYICSECNACADYFISGHYYFDEKPNFCPNCGARMGGKKATLTERCSNYMDCDGSCFIDDTPCDCGGNIEKCKGR